MATEVDTDAGRLDQSTKGWRPSGQPAHRASLPEDGPQIIEQRPELGMLGLVGQFLKRPFVRLVIGLGVFISGALVYDKTVNYREWTERAEKAKAANHRGLERIQQTPDG